MAKRQALAPRMASLAESAVAAAAASRVMLDYSAESAGAVEGLIAAVERDARVALDLPAGARVADYLDGLLDLDALGAYYGELFVRLAGAAWVEAECEDRLQPAVVRGAVVLHPRDAVRRRVYDGPHVDLVKTFRQESRAMAKQPG